MKPEDMKRIIDRIRKLLAVTEERGATANEAAHAARAVEGTLRKYQLEMKDIILNDLKEGGISEMWARGTKNKPNMSKQAKLPTWTGVLAVSVAKLFEVFAKEGHWPEIGKVVIFVGYTLDVEVAKWTYEYLMGEIERALIQTEKTMEERSRNADKIAREELREAILFLGAASKGRNASFRQGMVLELVRRLEEAVAAKRKEAVAAKGTVEGTGTALIVISKAHALTQYLGFNPDEGYGEARMRPVHAVAYRKGQEEGRKVNLSPNPIDFRDNRTDQKRLDTKTKDPVHMDGVAFYPVVVWADGSLVRRSFTEDTREGAVREGEALAHRNSNMGAKYLGVVSGEDIKQCQEHAREFADDLGHEEKPR